jgi:predicted glycogen debranching enzyme
MTSNRFLSEQLQDFEYSQSLEWLETNGLGGFASSTVSGANSRRYHGLLVAAMKPPVDRRVVLSKLEESVVVGQQRFELSANRYPGAVNPNGYQHLSSFEKSYFPVFTYDLNGLVIQKTIAMVHGENTTLVLYEVLSSKEKFLMELLPLCSFKDFHCNAHANDSIYKGFLFDRGVFQTKNYQESAELFISVPGSKFEPTQCWYYNFEYSAERSRGLDFTEDLFNHGKFTVELKAGSKLGIIISTEDCRGKDAFKLFKSELKRRESLVKKFANVNTQRLALAADQFVVKRGEDLRSIIAGYHWFSDWGRDTMIALPGICLVTERFDDARKILKAFADSVSEGMLPNRFPDHGEIPEYNTVDATLWFFQAIYKYYQYTSDKAFVKILLPVLEDIIDWHYKGTRYNIHVDADELIYSGQEGVQLTWMDAKIGDWVVTPRRGKVVEINALWFNALAILAELFVVTGGSKTKSAHYKQKSQRVYKSFNEVFWSEEAKYLYDFVDGDQKNSDLRPNQIYALALPFQLLSEEKARAILEITTEKLLTAWGLRSLDPANPAYKSQYEGDPWHRDSAYHQGTVWSHLLGIYIDALINIDGDVGKKKAVEILFTFFNHLDECGLGTVSEIFDAELPHHPAGTIAQAWSVGELLRVAIEHDLVNIGKKKTESMGA